MVGYRHQDKRKSNPQIGLVDPEIDPEQPKTARKYDPHLDPTLQFDVGRSQISHMIADSTWEQYAANVFEKSDLVTAYTKNDHLGYQIYYPSNGSRHRFLPDFLVKFANGETLVLEMKGEDSERDRAKRSVLDAWAKGVSTKGGFGTWCWDVTLKPAETQDIVRKHAGAVTFAP